MCGIVGFIGSGDRRNLEDMMVTLHHRGPDDEGLYVEGPVHLGHKRLSIIDLSENGRQPMSNEDGTVRISFNGEIYNYRELRKSLLERGHRFRSNTDSEVIVHLYEDRGVETFGMLNGMFAVALWDAKRRELYLARDRMGQKPLYYALVGDTFLFASEARALLQHPRVDKRLNLKSLSKYFFYEHVPTPDCIWEDIRQLPPASCARYRPETRCLSIEKYWKLRYLPRLSLKKQEAAQGLEELLLRSLRRHLVADVPVGVYLSGGMDSTTMAYYCQKLLNGNLKTFTVAFHEDTFDEQHQARETAVMLQSEHHEIRFTAEDFIRTTFEAVPRMDAPFADSSFVPAYHLNRLAREHIKVAIGGEGGDELFVGYPYFRAHELLKYLRSVPAWARRHLLYPLINGIPSSYANETYDYRLKKFIGAEGYLDNPYYCQQIWIGAFGPAQLPSLLKRDVHETAHMEDLFENIDACIEDAQEGEELLDGLLRQTQHKYLMDDGLTKTDRASMANSIEMRAPLLDNELVEWVNRLPFEDKYRKGRTKIVLRNLMNDKLPKSILRGRKRGFTPPIAQWFLNGFREQMKEVVFSRDEYLDARYVERIWKEHAQRKQNHRKLLWTLFVWKLWSGANL